MNNERVTSPTGLAKYPKLNEPDFKFKPQEGLFSVQLIYTPEEAKPFISQLEAIYKKAYQAACQEAGKKTIKRAPHIPWGQELDKDDNETGNIFVKFNMKHKHFNKQGDLAFEQRPALFDAAGSPSQDLVGGGSRIKVNAEVNPWNVPALGFGVSLRMKAAQIIELRSPSGPMNAESYGFSSEEETHANGGETFPEAVFEKATVSTGDEDTSDPSDF